MNVLRYVDSDGLICGLRPPLLKKIMREAASYPSGAISVEQAAKCLGRPHKKTVALLAKLHQTGWIEPDEGLWAPTQLGCRLAATISLNVKRFPRKLGLQIVERVVREAEKINNETHSREISEIRLFGSCLTAADDELIGDVDLMVAQRRRELPSDVLERLKRDERRERPPSASYWDRLSWPERRLRVRIRKLDRRISISPDLDFLDEHEPTKLVFPR